MVEEKYQYCTSNTFKKDITELCEKCPIKELIIYGIENQINLQAREQKQILTKVQFEKYITNEIENAQASMTRIYNVELNNINYKGDINRKNRIQNYIYNKERIKALNLLLKTKNEHSIEKNIQFEDMFYNPNDAKVCIDILRQLSIPVIDAQTNYIGKNKGIFPLWLRVLKDHKPSSLIKHFKDFEYKNILNEKIGNLNLSEDASEFRKHYRSLEKNKIELEIKNILSQFSQQGRLGK